MKVVFHTGAHHTDDDRILKCLLNNKGPFSKRGVAVPGPGKYRTLLKETFAAMDTAEPSSDARDVLVDAILDDERADRLILSNQHFFGSPRFSLGGGQLYPLATRRLRQVMQLFEGDEVELFMALCNPATFVPNVLSKASPAQQREILSENNPLALRWIDLMARIKQTLPELKITVWCNEDTPLIWGQIIRDMAGIPYGEKIIGNFDLLREIMSREGMKLLRRHMAEHPNLTESQKHRVIAAFLDKFALDDALEEEVDLPDWTEELVEELTASYDHDVSLLRNIDGVKMIAV